MIQNDIMRAVIQYDVPSRPGTRADKCTEMNQLYPTVAHLIQDWYLFVQ